MCNLYNIRSTQRTILDWARATRDHYGNLEPALDVFPDYPAPVVRNDGDGERELVRLRWGMPTPPERLKGNADRGTTNIRNPSYAHWRRWMGVEHRCVVPATSFAEPSPRKDGNGKTPNVWFALDESEPLFAFAGIWAQWHGVRKVKDGAADFELFGFLTTRPNAVVAPVHEKAMPVILRNRDEIETWLRAPVGEALRLQRPLPDDAVRIVAVTEKERYSAEAFPAADTPGDQLRLL
jgi:putative SOS response-associated peptidase YedK